MTVGDNIGTVPKLLGWSKQRIVERSHMLLELVGLDATDIDRIRRSSPAASGSASGSRARWPRIPRSC